MDNAQPIKSTNEIAVGSFTVLAIILLLCGWLWLKDVRPFAYAKHYQVKFHDVSGLHVPSGVKVNGVAAGTVESMKLTADDDVLVGYRINSKDTILRQNATFTISGPSPIAAKGLAISMPPAQEGISQSPILDSQTIAIGEDSVPLDALINKLASTLKDLNAGGLSKQLSSDMKKMAKAVDSVNTTSHRFGEVANTANAMSGDLKATASQMNTATKQVTQMLDKRHPLVHMLFGRPGHLKSQPKSQDSATTTETTTSATVTQTTK